jgi:chorismate mutase
MSELLEFRNRIDQVDHKIIKLLAKRFDIVKHIGNYKKEHNITPLQSTRWEYVIKDRSKIAEKYGISPLLITDIWNMIHEYALNLEK